MCGTGTAATLLTWRPRGREGSTPSPSADTPARNAELGTRNEQSLFFIPHSPFRTPRFEDALVVKRTSFHASNVAFRVRILAGVLRVGPVAQRRRRLPDAEEIGGSSPPRITGSRFALTDAACGVTDARGSVTAEERGSTPP